LARRRVLCEDLATLLLPTLLFAAVCCFEPTLPQGVVTRAQDGVEPFRLNIQTAAWYEWALLNGIGESRGKKIVAFRTSRGGFTSVEELALVPGLPRGWLDGAREHLAAR
jgi:competence ComEA-like helix-hairpin-helix protein